MPVYMCTAVEGAISDKAKAEIAADITEVHCDIIGVVPAAVHVFFFEDAPPESLNGTRAFLCGYIRSGHTLEERAMLVERMKQSIQARSRIAPGEIVVDTTVIPVSWIMNGGDVLPEPGIESARLEAH